MKFDLRHTLSCGVFRRSDSFRFVRRNDDGVDSRIVALSPVGTILQYFNGSYPAPSFDCNSQ